MKIRALYETLSVMAYFIASEAVCPSGRGDRYVIMGVLIAVSCVLEMISGFVIRDVLIGI